MTAIRACDFCGGNPLSKSHEERHAARAAEMSEREQMVDNAGLSLFFAKTEQKFPENWAGVMDLMADFALQETAELKAKVEMLRTSNRYALATFRALDQYTFQDSDHGLLIAEAVKKLEADEEALDSLTDQQAG